ncbi:MAG: hypothetical protein ACRDHL_12990 [Candidatus Promineifilaceae bacterium]
MAVFASSDELYACLDDLFRRVQDAHPGAAGTLAKARLLIRFRCSEPVAVVVIDGRSRPPAVRFGTVSARPDTEVALPADVLHRILLGQMSVPAALGSRAMAVQGSTLKVLMLVELFRYCQRHYPLVLKQRRLAV